MTGERPDRRLAAILAADVAGYSRLMGADEVGTLSALKSIRREIVDPAIASHKGRIVKTTGDGLLVEFASAVDAVTCAMEMQGKMAQGTDHASRNIVFRIGINVGDIIVDDDDIFGDGVNIAARLEGIADPGGLCISDDAYRQVRGKVDVVFADIGPQDLKNIAEPIRAWRAKPGEPAGAAVPATQAPTSPPIDKPSIAVLPFANISNNPDHEFFADGMTEDIITSLSRLRDVLVIARNSTFIYKGKNTDAKQVGRELGVRYVLEGSVRRAGNRLRITGQLIETTAGSHVWADRWDCELEDIFELQDQITARIHNAIGGVLVKTEAGRVLRSTRANIQAWQLRLKAWEGFHRWDREGCLQGVELGRRAIDLDPDETNSHLVTAACLYAVASSGWTTSGQEDIAEVVNLSSRAINLDPDNGLAHSLLGMALLSFGRHDEAVSEVRRGCEAAPGSYEASVSAGIVLGYSGEARESLKSFETALLVSPRDPRLYTTYQSQCIPLFVLDRYEEIVSSAQRVMRQVPNWTETFTMQAAAYARLGRLDHARAAVGQLRNVDPRYSVQRALRRHPYRDAIDRDKLADALRQAGLN